MVGTLLYLVLVALMLSILLAVVLLPVIAMIFYMWRRERGLPLPGARRRALVHPGEPLLSGLENPNG